MVFDLTLSAIERRNVGGMVLLGEESEGEAGEDEDDAAACDVETSGIAVDEGRKVVADDGAHRTAAADTRPVESVD